MTQPSLRVVGLVCEYQTTSPLGLQAWPPRQSWRLESAARGARQTAYQIRAGGDPDALAADLGAGWDSGRVATDESLFQNYGGAKMQSGQRAYLKVRVWDGQTMTSR